MKHTNHTVKFRKPKSQADQTQRQPSGPGAARSFLPRWAVISVCLFVAGGGTWALFEFVIWSKLPPELVGKWEVFTGPQMGAVFEFSRKGALEAHLHNVRTGMMEIMQATVRVEDKTLFVTTQSLRTGQPETQSCMIRELTPYSLIVEFDTGEVYKMSKVR